MDDTILIGAASVKEAREFKRILQIYEAASHQKINLNKTNIYFFNTPDFSKEMIKRIIKCEEAKLPTKYLGMSLFLRRVKEFWNGVIEKLENKMIGWKNALLNHARRLQLIKTILQSILVYLANIFPISQLVSKKIDQICRKFL